MTVSLAIQNTYDAIELALFKDATLLDVIRADKTHASKQIIPLLSSLLTKNNITFNQIQYLAVNQGPGPFTTLRVIIATVNGLSFAAHIPLIGIDGMHALLAQYKNETAVATIALLDAFNKDIYFAIQKGNTLITSGYKKSDLLIQELTESYRHKEILLVGNAAQLYQDELIQSLGDTIIINEDAQTCSIEQIGIMAYAKWQQQEGLTYQLFPLYLKQQQYKNQQGQIKTI